MVIAFIGHTDHGKTSLLENIVNQKADKRKEEQERGITIDASFFYYEINNKSLIFIDIPGHKNLIQNMILGISSANHVLLCIAATGISEQTIEHLEIAYLLQKTSVDVVFTKIDVVDTDTLKDTVLQTEHLLKEFNIDARFFYISNKTKEGIAELAAYLSRLNSINPQRDCARFFIDRVFISKGFGTIITGNLQGDLQERGSLFQSMNKKIHIRSIQQNKSPIIHAKNGRFALNITINHQEISKGDILCDEKLVNQNTIFDVFLTRNKIHNISNVMIYFQTTKQIVKILPISEHRQGLFAQIRLDKPIPLIFNDVILIAHLENKQVLTNAIVLHSSQKHKYKGPENILFLEKMLCSNCAYLDYISHHQGVYEHDFIVNFGVNFNNCSDVLTDVLKIDNILISKVKYLEIQNSLVAQIDKFHKDNPEKIGINVFDLKKYFTYKKELFGFVLNKLLTEDIIKRLTFFISLKEFSIKIDVSKQALNNDILFTLEQNYNNCYVRDLAVLLVKEITAVQEAMFVLKNLGIVIEIKKDLFYSTAQIKNLLNIASNLVKNDCLTVRDFCNSTNLGRKRAILILEFFDRLKISRRVKDYRIINDAQNLLD